MESICKIGQTTYIGCLPYRHYAKMIACLALSSSCTRSPAPGGRGKKEETLHGLIRTQRPSHHWLLLAHPCLVLPREGLGVSVVGLFHRAALWLPLSNNQCGLAMFRMLKSSSEVLLCYRQRFTAGAHGAHHLFSIKTESWFMGGPLHSKSGWISLTQHESLSDIRTFCL